MTTKDLDQQTEAIETKTENPLHAVGQEAAEQLFITGKYSRKGFNKEQRELIEARSGVMRDDWDAGDYPGWREAK